MSDKRATRTREGIQNFLNTRKADSPFLLSRYSVDLETQLMCSSDGVPGENGHFSDPKTNEVWSNKRWPFKAGTDPNYSDPPLEFSPAKRVEAVGCTWWDYIAKKSVAVGIDIDTEEGHAITTNTNSKSDIVSLVDRLKVLDYVTIVRSTGGKGLHVYVFFDPDNLPDAMNHHEHTIVARKTLKLIGQDIDYDLSKQTDCVGSVFWIWSQRSPEGHKGFSLIKEGKYLDATRLAAITLPAPSIRGGDGADFESVDLDDDHKRIIEAIQCQPYYFNYRADLNLIHTHTCAIAAAIKAGLKVRGDYHTNSRGDEPNSPNCFMAPQRGGVFRIVRFGQSRHEKGWKWINEKNFCFFNDALSPQEILSRNAEKFSQGKYFLTPEGAAEVANLLGKPLAHPAPSDVWAVLTDDGIDMLSKTGASGWVKTGETHKVALDVDLSEFGSFEDRVMRQCDDVVRYVIQDGNIRGWFHKLSDGSWLEHANYSEIDCVTKGMFKEYERYARELMTTNPWTLTSVPFEQEYPGKRLWNRNAPQLKVVPTVSGGDHPHYDMILEHIGSDLDHAVSKSEWCRKGNIQSGADYLLCWVAALVHHVDQPLPYVFLGGPQDSGKSVFAEMLSYLFTHGVEAAARALTSDFNGELEGCFLAVIEEKDLADKRHNAYAKIKEWVTGRTLAIRRLYQQQFTTKNYLHFVQMANSTTHLPMEDGDTRIVAIDVPALKSPVPKEVMEEALEREAPRFARTILNTVVPKPIDRLRIPTLRTKTKDLMERRAMTTVMAMCKEKLFSCTGRKVEIPVWYEAYEKYCKARGASPDASYAAYHELMQRSDRYKLDKIGGKDYILNVSLDEKARPKGKAL
jgi:hypothetical protein